MWNVYSVNWVSIPTPIAHLGRLEHQFRSAHWARRLKPLARPEWEHHPEWGESDNFHRNSRLAPQRADLGAGLVDANWVRQCVLYDYTKLPLDVHHLKQSLSTSKTFGYPQITSNIQKLSVRFSSSDRSVWGFCLETRSSGIERGFLRSARMVRL